MSKEIRHLLWIMVACFFLIAISPFEIALLFAGIVIILGLRVQYLYNKQQKT